MYWFSKRRADSTATVRPKTLHCSYFWFDQVVMEAEMLRDHPAEPWGEKELVKFPLPWSDPTDNTWLEMKEPGGSNSIWKVFVFFFLNIITKSQTNVGWERP